MDRRSRTVLLVLTGVLLLLYPALRPYSSEVGLAGAEAFASPRWTLSHVLAMVGLIILVPAVRALAPGRVAGTATFAGVALVLPYYGAETFALGVLGTEAVRTGDHALVDLADPIRFGMTQTVMFALGLVLIAAGGVALARRLGGWQVWLLAAGLVLLGPQFFAPPWLRIAHGVLVLAGCLAVATQRRTDEVGAQPARDRGGAAAAAG